MASIRPRPRADGTTAYAVLWRDPDTGRQTSMQFAIEGDAENFRRIIEANGGSLNAAETFLERSTVAGPTVVELIERHARHVTGATEYTVKRYRANLRLHIATSALGSYKANAVTGGDLRQWIQWMQERGKSPKTISNVFGLISSAFIGAARDGLIDRNPCAGVRLPKKDKAGDDGEMTREDFDAIRARIDPHFQPFLDFLLGTGCRFSEATAVEAADFKLSAATPIVRISKAWKQADAGGWYIGPPKTAKGKRTISLAPSTVDALGGPLASAGRGRVFRMKRGGMMTPQAFYNRAWEAARREAGLEDKVTVHSIRHLHAAMMLQAGMDIYELSRRMGHESVQMTIDLYSHLLPDAHFRQAEAAHRALGV